MKDKDFLSHIDSCGLKPRFHANKFTGEVVWGISERSIECYILHDISGRAYDGLYLREGAKVVLGMITPTYKSHLLKSSGLDLGDIIGNTITLPMVKGFPWGIIEVDKEAGKYMLFDVYGRVFEMPVLAKGEEFLTSLVLPAYNGTILRACPKYDFKRNNIT